MFTGIGNTLGKMGSQLGDAFGGGDGGAGLGSIASLLGGGGGPQAPRIQSTGQRQTPVTPQALAKVPNLVGLTPRARGVLKGGLK